MAESEDNTSLNYYGSSLFQSEESNMAMDPFVEESDESSESIEPPTMNCSCKSQCLHKLKTSASGKITGCVCKGYGVLCGENCSCGTKSKPCQNKAQPSRQTGTVVQCCENEQSEVSVEEIIEGLDRDTLVKVAKEGFMS